MDRTTKKMVYFSYLDPDEPSGIVPRKPNGGLYTGTEAPKGAPWANVPIVPEQDVMATLGAASSVAPLAHWFPVLNRPGNNDSKNVLNQPFKPGYENVRCHR